MCSGPERKGEADGVGQKAQVKQCWPPRKRKQWRAGLLQRTAPGLKARMVARWASGWGRGTHMPSSSAHPSPWENKAGLRDHFLADSVVKCPRMKMC